MDNSIKEEPDGNGLCMLTREGNNRYEWSLPESFEAKSDVPFAPARRGALVVRNRFLYTRQVIQQS